MTFLDLCKKVRLKADLTGSGPATVVNQVGILEKIVDWVLDANDDIQREDEWWLFRKKTDTANLITGMSDYDATFLPADFDFFWPKSIYYNILGGKGGQLTLISWERYTEQYLYENLHPEQPSEIAIDPTGRVYFNSKPTENLVIKFEYQQKLVNLANNGDVPLIPVDYHGAIWRLALMRYGEHFGAPEVYEPASEQYEDLMQRMRNRYLPELKFTENVYYGYTAP